MPGIFTAFAFLNVPLLGAACPLPLGVFGRVSSTCSRSAGLRYFCNATAQIIHLDDKGSLKATEQDDLGSWGCRELPLRVNTRPQFYLFEDEAPPVIFIRQREQVTFLKLRPQLAQVRLPIARLLRILKLLV